MELITSLFGSDLQTGIFIVLNLVLIESLLSIDNAAVLATMVMDLPENLRDKALKYGIFGAYLFRGLCLIFASALIHNPYLGWLKLLGGLYLLYLAIKFFFNKKDIETGNEEESQNKNKNWLYMISSKFLGQFWSTVLVLELVDLTFSIDNVFAAVAFTDKIGLICLGVFIGILAMRFAAQVFVKLMDKYPFLESSAFMVIGFLGLKLVFSYVCGFHDHNPGCKILESHMADLISSLFTISLFVIPFFFHKSQNKNYHFNR